MKLILLFFVVDKGLKIPNLFPQLKTRLSVTSYLSSKLGARKDGKIPKLNSAEYSNEHNFLSKKFLMLRFCTHLKISNLYHLNWKISVLEHFRKKYSKFWVKWSVCSNTRYSLMAPSKIFFSRILTSIRTVELKTKFDFNLEPSRIPLFHPKHRNGKILKESSRFNWV